MKRLMISLLALCFFSSCEPRDVRLLQDSERGKKGVNSRADQEVFFGDTSAAIFALEKQIEIINALEMTLHPEFAGEIGYAVKDDRNSGRKNTPPVLNFYQRQNTILEKGRQDSVLSWQASASMEPLKLEGVGSVALYSELPGPANINAKVEQELVEITTDEDNQNLYHIEIKMMKISISKELPKPYLTEVMISSQITVRRDETAVGLPARYTMTKSSFSISNNKGRNAVPSRTLNLSVSENFSVHLGICPYAVGSLSLMNSENKKDKDLVQLKEDSLINLSTMAEEKLIPCTETTIRPLIDLSRILRM